ncbi:PREDICTED: gustatory receptor for sugar taste 64f-like [Polistes canadensis]|uniref:gustatory receptor for sugar taste 64f-like n=1 Tax=Polistes canadensis TaxID=91411 RepID=UPI000718E4B8|nr:PREDICTED: gustatory receptor for sugar taste 64f-like [Polistes canadensis]
MDRNSRSNRTIWQRFKKLFVKRNNISRSPRSNLQLSRFDTLKTDVENPEVSDPDVSLVNSFNPATDSFHASIRPIILLANCFSMLPVSGVNSPDASYLKQVDTINFEHTLSILKGFSYATNCAKYRGDSDIVAEYFESQFPQVFSRKTYSLWKAILVDTVNILSTFSWNFVDLFLILVSMALADQFQQLNSRLNSVKGKTMPDWWWAEARNDYNHLAGLTRRVDSHISTIVFLSFATDLYFICIQLLFSFNLQRSHIQKIYFCFSFGFLLTRTTAVSLYAASVHDESRLPAPILYSVSSASYSTEPNCGHA